MKAKYTWFWYAAILMLIPAMGAGCRSAKPPVATYTLSSIRGMEARFSPNSDPTEFTIGIGPVRLPDYLDRPQIVTRSGPNRIHISEFNRWGGRLDENFLNILAENLSILLSTHRVSIYPFKGQAVPDYRIALDIHQFEGEMGDSVLLNVTWTVRGSETGKEPLHIKGSIISQPVSGQNYDALVSACSRAVAELSREVAAVLKEINSTPR